MSYSESLEPSPCTWCQKLIDAGTQSPQQGCFIQFVQGQVDSWATEIRYKSDGGQYVQLCHPNGMPDQKYLKARAASRQEVWEDESDGVNYFAECDAQYLGKQ